MASLSSRYLMLLLTCCAACAPVATSAAMTATFPVTTAASPLPSTPEASVTPGPDASPTPTTTPAPAPRLFTETFDGPLPHWSFQQAGSSQAADLPVVRDGFLVFNLTAPNQWAYAIYGGPDYADVMVEAQMQNRTSGDGGAGVICRYGKDAGWYELNIFADGTYQLLFGQWLSSGVATYIPLYRGVAETPPGDESTIGLQCLGETLTPTINGQAQRKWQELRFGLQKGKIGLTVSAFADVPLRAAFDSVKVSEP